MGFGLNVTFVGLFVVFSALILLAFIISLISRIMRSAQGKKDAVKDSIEEAVSNEVSVTQYIADEQAGTSEDMPVNELIAVLTAAITAALKPDQNTKIRVSSFRRIPQNSPVWNKAGRTEYIAGKL